MNIRPQAPEYVQAQIDLVATADEVDYLIAGSLVDESEDLAALPELPQMMARKYDDSDARASTLMRNEYLQELRTITASHHGRQALRCAAQARQRYEAFTPEVEELRDYIEAGTAHELGSGNESAVYLLSKAGERYAVSMPYDELGGDPLFDVVGFYGGPEMYQAYKTARIAAALACGQGIEGAKQLAAYRPTEGVCISPYVPGRQVDQITPEETARITPEHVQGYVDTVAQLAARELTLDYGPDSNNPSNILWDRARGFTVIEYFRNRPSYTDLENSVKVLAKALICHDESFGEDGGPREWREKAVAAMPALEVLDELAVEKLGCGVDYLNCEDDDDIRQFLRS